jgi:hypothetical protein
MKIETENAPRPWLIGIAGMYVVLAAAIFFFAFDNLGGRMLWGDEAETATLARNVLKFGVPKVDDGLNHISLHGDKFDARDGIWTWSPWLQEYVTAASFGVFGINTWAARAPFALIGWLAVMLLGAVAWKIYRRHQIALAAMLLLGTSEVFLLHIRQCRYYSITVLAEILLVYGIYQVLQKNKSGSWLIASALVLLFYCNYTIAAANVPLLLVLGVMLFRQDRRSAWPVVISLSACALVCSPWLLYTEIWRERAAEGDIPWADKIGFYSSQFHFHFFPWCVLLLPAWGWLSGRRKKNTDVTPEERPIIHFENYLLLLPVLYLPVLLVMPGEYLRYLLPVLPVACLLVTAWLFRYIRWTVVAIAILLVQCFSNLFAVATSPFERHALRSPIAEFVSSVGQSYDDRFTDVLKFLKTQARPGDVILSWDPELPLVFYGQYQVIDARLPARSVGTQPDWILPKSISSVFDEPPVLLPDALKLRYERVVLSVHDSSRLADIPEPDLYEYKSTDAKEQFVLYRLKEANSNSPASPAKP